jgi:hypothetical protein
MTRSAWVALSLIVMALLAACTSTEQALDPGAITPPKGQDGASSGGVSTAAAPPSAAAIAKAVAGVRIEIAPIVGPAVDATAPLTAGIAEQAGKRGIGIANGTEAAATHVLKGYFSAISEGRDTIVIYVWDVLDPAGNRLHRIQGQEKTPARGGEGWSSVPPALMQAIADRTIDQFVAWLATQPG